MIKRQIIKEAFWAAQDRRPYKQDDEIVEAMIPAGGNWECIAEAGAITRLIKWGNTEVALMNPRGDLGDIIEGQIAMAFRSLPLMDHALRSIIVLAENPENLALIREMAATCIAYVEMPAPAIPEPDDEEHGEDIEA